MKNKAILYFAAVLLVFCMLFPCGAMAQQGKEQTERPYDSVNIPAEYLELVKQHPEDEVVQVVPYFKVALSNQDKVVDATDFLTREDAAELLRVDEDPTFYVRSGEDGSIRKVYINQETGELKDISERPNQENIFLCFEILDHPENFFSPGTVIKELYFFGDRDNHDGACGYIVTDKGDCMVYASISTQADYMENLTVQSPNDPCWIMPVEEFRDILKEYEKIYPKLEPVFGASRFTVAMFCSENYDFSKFSKPLVLKEYKMNAALKTILPIAGGVLVAAAIVLTIILAKNASEQEEKRADAPVQN